MAWIEVEAKIKIEDVDSVREKIKNIAKFVRKEEKTDDYYSLENGKYPKKSLRVRDKGNTREVNFKEKISYKQGIWAKKEVEFEVSDINNFFDLLDNFGFKRWVRKEKKTELYKTNDGVSIELNQVKNLGWFVEIEYLSKKKDVDKARKRVKEIREHLGFGEKDSSKKGYTKELWNLKR